MSDSRLIRVGIVGSSRGGHGFWECLLVRPHCEVILYEPEDEHANCQDRPPCHLTTNDWGRFLSDDAIEAVLFLDGRSLDREQVQSALDAGLKVGILPPLTMDILDWPAFPSASETQIRLLNQHPNDPDFLAVRAWRNSNSLKPNSAIKRISWVADLIEPVDSSSRNDNGWFSNWLWEDLDQLLVLTGSLPRSVFAAEFSPERQSYFLFLKFADGVTAQLERRRDSLVPLELGWTISQGFAPQRQYLRTDDGEIYDVPLAEPAPCDAALNPLSVFQRPGQEEHSWNHASDVLTVLSAILASAESGSVTCLPE